MFPFAALFGLSLVLPRRVQIIPRARVVASAANDTLTVGDALAGSLRRNIADLPEHEHLARAERTLDAMLVSGSAELDALQREFDRDPKNWGEDGPPPDILLSCGVVAAPLYGPPIYSRRAPAPARGQSILGSHLRNPQTSACT